MKVHGIEPDLCGGNHKGLQKREKNTSRDDTRPVQL